MATESGRKRWRAFLAEVDRRAKDFLSDFYDTPTDAVRGAISAQVGRDVRKTTDRSLATAVRLSVNDMRSKSKIHGRGEYGMKSFVLFLSEDDKANLDRLVETHQLDGRVAAVRFAIRMEAASRGWRPPGGVW